MSAPSVGQEPTQLARPDWAALAGHCFGVARAARTVAELQRLASGLGEPRKSNRVESNQINSNRLHWARNCSLERPGETLGGGPSQVF